MTKDNDKINFVNFPEEIDEENGIKIYGETSYENQIAFLSHYLHNEGLSETGGQFELRANLISSIYAFLEHKNKLQNYTEEEILKVADNPFQMDLFSDFYDVPFPAPKNPKHTFVDLFRWHWRHSHPV
ncbi:MAG: hypothetical protein IKH05_06470 [Bacteroidaceae bacterium]|nr:hypothetical protein [Bacteroidaceae bacterium]